MSELIIYGAGAWGTALAIHAARRGHGVTLWARDAGRAAEMQRARVNTRLLPGVSFPEALHVTHDVAPGAASLGILAIPVQPLRGVLSALPRGLPPMLLVCKGLEADTLQLPLEVLTQVRPDLTGGILSGPNFAHEVAAGLPAASVVAARDPALCELAQGMLSGGTLRLYASEDVLGVQLGGAAKTVLAIAAGISTGAGLGENARAALITRGLAELSRLVTGLGG
jgi:glycerol-3-phosphate dehydrogenase (NAD(P)+)